MNEEQRGSEMLGNRAVEIAKIMLDTDELPLALETQIRRANERCARAGGALISRQAIAVLIEFSLQEAPNA